ncbi:hypothetical protein [Paraflavitalea speifideaquila]|uniref:hypothetical protein n=1 Tax=Paraflavitalea speifideaquila TaxID=3076558 RepID=UPI0028F0DF53|nr:hypothetical protein [Paraflavitalea speifideiaquila]
MPGWPWAVFIVAGLLDTRKADMEAVALGAAIFIFYLANLYLLYRSYKKNITLPIG